MKVIEQGVGAWRKRFTCQGCSAVLEADESDIDYVVTEFHTEAQQYKEDIEGDFNVACPDCGQIKRLTDVPPAIKKKIKERE